MGGSIWGSSRGTHEHWGLFVVSMPWIFFTGSGKGHHVHVNDVTQQRNCAPSLRGQPVDGSVEKRHGRMYSPP